MCRMYGRNVFSCRNVNLYHKGVPARPPGSSHRMHSPCSFLLSSLIWVYLKYAKGMDEECSDTSKFLRKWSIKGLIFFKVFPFFFSSTFSWWQKRRLFGHPRSYQRVRNGPEPPAHLLSVFTNWIFNRHSPSECPSCPEVNQGEFLNYISSKEPKYQLTDRF